MPCFSTLSRSTSAKYCGVLGRSVVKSSANSGRFRAAARNFSVFWARKRDPTGAVFQHEGHARRRADA
jgi:hypothetical protein